jgi:hypothetical protein
MTSRGEPPKVAIVTGASLTAVNLDGFFHLTSASFAT